MEVLQVFIERVLVPIFGEPHLGLFMFVWFSAVFPLAPPEEAFTLLGGACIAHDILHPFWGSGAVIGGIIATDLTQYWMGRGGLKLLGTTKIGKRFIASRAFRRACRSFGRRGIWAIVGCRFFFGTRAPTYMATGFMRFSFARFALVDSSVVLLHGLLFLGVGYLFSEQIDAILEFVKRLGIWNLVVLLGVIGLVAVIKLRKRQRWQQTDEDDRPTA
ncbi:MAG: hypothetical protein DRI34_06455 [Deltaproteobacteria bacterium]|nr:MAG: hypothetical protein DRI34_06455 [Deltaproteobacteria bacterium]